MDPLALDSAFIIRFDNLAVELPVSCVTRFLLTVFSLVVFLAVLLDGTIIYCAKDLFKVSQTITALVGQLTSLSFFACPFQSGCLEILLGIVPPLF